MPKSIEQLRREVEELEKRNKQLAKIKAAKDKADKQRKNLEDRLRRLKGYNSKTGKLKDNLRKYGKKASPLLKRIKSSIDQAARNY